MTHHVNFIVNNVVLPGQYYDSETGLHYNNYRDYDPSTGRYVESDPIGLDGGLNTYGYVYQNPVNYYDPDGQFVNYILGAATSVAIGFTIAKLTGDECYGLQNALVDAAFGAAGVGIISKVKRLNDIRKLRNLAKERGLEAKKITSHIEDYRNPSNPTERLKIKLSPSQNATGPLSANARVEYKVGTGTYKNPFTGEIGKGAEFSHVPIGEITAGEAAATGAAVGTLTPCDCK